MPGLAICEVIYFPIMCRHNLILKFCVVKFQLLLKIKLLQMFPLRKKKLNPGLIYDFKISSA